MQVDFDPAQITYEEILNMIWEGHNPTRAAWSRQYMSAIWYENDAQLEMVNKTATMQADKNRWKIKTPILSLETFYNAEDYHQKYSLQKYRGLMKSFNAMYPDFKGFVDSTAAARLNGFVSGRGTEALFNEEADGYGITRDQIESASRR